MEKLVKFHENEKYGTNWSLENNFENIKSMMNSIVTIDIIIDSMDVAFKLNQNKSLENQKSVISHLEKSVDNNNFVSFMKKELNIP